MNAPWTPKAYRERLMQVFTGVPRTYHVRGDPGCIASVCCYTHDAHCVMWVTPAKHPVLLTDTPCDPKAYRECMMLST